MVIGGETIIRKNSCDAPAVNPDPDSSPSSNSRG